MRPLDPETHAWLLMCLLIHCTRRWRLIQYEAYICIDSTVQYAIVVMVDSEDDFTFFYNSTKTGKGTVQYSTYSTAQYCITWYKTLRTTVTTKTSSFSSPCYSILHWTGFFQYCRTHFLVNVSFENLWPFHDLVCDFVMEFIISVNLLHPGHFSTHYKLPDQHDIQ